MASALHQLIAQSAGPNILGSAMQGLAQADRAKAQEQDAQLNQQRISLGQRQLAQADKEYAAKKQAEGAKLAANTAISLEKVTDPAQQDAMYQAALQRAAQDGHDVSQWPKDYMSAKPILQHYKSQVYGGEQFKTDEKIRAEQAKPAGPSSDIGKLQADMALLPEGDPRRAEYEAAIRKKTYIAPPSAGRGDDAPASVKEYEYFQRLTPEEQDAYLKTKRGDRVSAGTEKAILGAADVAQSENIKYVNYSDLADRFQSMAKTMPSGAAASVSEWLKEQTGSQDAMSLMRKDWASVKGSEVVANLPPGAASDADVKMALAGFLPNNANPQAVASFLRGVAKLSKLNGEYAAFKADYLSENKTSAGIRKAWQERAKSLPAGSTKSSANQQQVGRFTIEVE